METQRLREAKKDQRRGKEQKETLGRDDNESTSS